MIPFVFIYITLCSLYINTIFRTDTTNNIMHEFSKIICECLCLMVSIVIIILAGLTYKIKRPHCYIQEFYVPALDLSLNSISNNNRTSTTTAVLINPCLFFDLAFENIMTDHSVRYGDVNLTFSYGRSAVANYVVPTFYQGMSKRADRREVVETSGVPWEAAVKAVSNGSAAVFRVDLVAQPRFGFWFWYSKRKGMRIGADVEVDGFGMKVKREDIRLTNLGASKSRVGIFVMFVGLLVTLLCFF
ncbi:hypothetical protein ACP275_13G029100 [Erythranthe tilingii]